MLSATNKPDAWTRTFSEKHRQLLGTAEELIAEAEREERRAEQYLGCSFHGEWPGASHRDRAILLRRAAAEITAAKRVAK